MPNQETNQDFVWSTAGGDASRRGLFPRKAEPASRPALRLAAHGAVQAEVIFDRPGNIFVADLAGVLQCFNDRGRHLWQAKLPGGISAAPVLNPAGTAVFVGTHDGAVFALDSVTGAALWRKEIPTKSDPRILSDLLFASASNAVVFSSWGEKFLALDAANGNTRFSWDAGVSPYSAAAADQAGSIYCLRAVNNVGVQLVRISTDGKESVLHTDRESARRAWRTLGAAGPVLDETRGVVYFIVNGEKSGRLSAWSLEKNQFAWSCDLPACVQGTPAILRVGSLAVADLAGVIHVIGPDGQVRHRYLTSSEYLLAGPVCDGDGNLFIGDPSGVVHVIDPAGKGRRLFEARRSLQARCAFHPNGSLCVPATDRTVYLFPNGEA